MVGIIRVILPNMAKTRIDFSSQVVSLLNVQCIMKSMLKIVNFLTRGARFIKEYSQTVDIEFLNNFYSLFFH